MLRPWVNFLSCMLYIRTFFFTRILILFLPGKKEYFQSCQQLPELEDKCHLYSVLQKQTWSLSRCYLYWPGGGGWLWKGVAPVLAGVPLPSPNRTWDSDWGTQALEKTWNQRLEYLLPPVDKLKPLLSVVLRTRAVIRNT